MTRMFPVLAMALLLMMGCGESNKSLEEETPAGLTDDTSLAGEARPSSQVDAAQEPSSPDPDPTPRPTADAQVPADAGASPEPRVDVESPPADGGATAPEEDVAGGEPTPTPGQPPSAPDPLPAGLTGQAPPADADKGPPSLAGVVDTTQAAAKDTDLIGHWSVLWFYPMASTSG